MAEKELQNGLGIEQVEVQPRCMGSGKRLLDKRKLNRKKDKKREENSEKCDDTQTAV